jgi:hypothetical protein
LDACSRLYTAVTKAEHAPCRPAEAGISCAHNPYPSNMRPISAAYGAETLPTVSPYSRPSTLAKLDGRTRESRLMREVRAELVAHVGGNPSATQRVLIERAVQLNLQIALLDAKQASGGYTEHDARAYLAWTNTLTRLMRQLGMKGAIERPRTLAEIHAARDAARTAA